MKPLVSIIIPVYNVAVYFPHCIESILRQTYSNLEIILIDDGSKDESGKLCDLYAEKDNRIRVIHQENKGVSAARNAGLAVYSGEYLMFVDADDYISHDAVELLYNRIKSDGSSLAIGQMTEVTDEKSEIHPMYKWMYDGVMTSSEAMLHFFGAEVLPAYSCAKLFHCSAFKNVTFPPIKCREDEWIFPTILENCEKISMISQVVYYYVQRDTSAVHTKNNALGMDSVRSLLHLAEFFMSRDMVDNAKFYFNSAIYQAMGLEDITEARKLLLSSFPVSERHVLIKKDCRTLARWVVISFPLIHRPLQRWYRSCKTIYSSIKR